MSRPGPSPRYDLEGAAEADFARLFPLRVAAMRESLERIGRFDERRAFDRFRAGFRPEHTRLILVGGALAGCVAMRPEGEELVLEHFYIDPAFQRRGLGAAVLRRLLAEADRAGRAVRLEVLRESEAGRFYRRFGFAETGREAFDILLRRPPGAGEAAAHPGEPAPATGAEGQDRS